MANTIEERIAQWSDDAAAGIPADVIFADPDYDVYRRAFRLKRFARCPACDEKAMNRADEIAHMGMYLWCHACQWTVWAPFDLDPDGLILDIVRGVPTR